MGNRGRNDSSSESDDWEDESWIVDCPCGVNFDDGEEMVECDECGVWVHTACCRVPKLLPSYVCDKCKYKKKQKEEESEVAQLLADLPSKPVSFEEKSVHKAEPFTPFRVPNNLPTEAKAHVTGIPGGDPSFFVGVPKMFGRQLWTYSGYVPKRFNADYDQLGDPREDTAELLRDLPNVVVPRFIEKRLKRIARLQENGRENTGNCQGSPHVCAEVPAPNPAELREVTSAELLSDETQVQDSTPRGKQVKTNHVKKVDVKAEGNVDVKAEGEAEGKSKHKHKSKVKDEKSPSHAKRAREDVGSKEHIVKKKIRARGDAVRSEEPLETLTKLEVVPETGLVPATHVLPQTSPKNPKAMKKLAVQEFMHGVLRICSRCRDGTPVPLSCGRTFYLSDWTCQKCGSLEGGTRPAGPAGPESGLSKEELGALPDNAGTCHDVGITGRKWGEGIDAVFKTPRFREDSKQICSSLDCPTSSIQGKESDEKHLPADLRAVEAHARQSHRERLWGSGELVNFQELDARLESPGKRIKRVDQDKEAGEIIEALESSEHRAPKSHSVPGVAGEVWASKICLVKSSTEVKCSSSDDSKSVAGANKNSGSVCPDPQVEKKVLKLQATSTISETRGQGSARTSGCLPASVREKFSQQQQRAVASSVAALQQASSRQSPGQTPAYSAQKVVSPSSAGVGTGVASTKVSHGEDSMSLQAHALGQQEGLTQVSKQLGRFTDSGSEGTRKPQEGPQDVPLLSQSPLSAQRLEGETIHRAKGQSGEAKEQVRTEGQSPVGCSPLPVVGAICNADIQEQKVPLPICQQARQSNGVGTYSRKSIAQIGGASKIGGASTAHNSEKTAVNVRMATSTKSDSKVLGAHMKSPLSSGTSSSPTSPLVTTPSSKIQAQSTKASGSPPPQRSLSGGTTPKSSSIPTHGGSKVSTSATTSSKQVGAQHTPKTAPTPPLTPLSSKAVNTAKQSSKFSSLQASKSDDLSTKLSSAVAPCRVNHGGPSSGGPAKDTLKNASHSSSKVSTAGKIVPQSTVSKAPSSSKHSHGTTKATPISSQNKQHLGSSKVSLQASTKPAATQHSKIMSTHKDEKSSLPPAPPVPKAVSTMPPPSPQVPTKRSPPTALTSPVTTTLKDEELALLLHQELNSSPRVPRVPRVRQAGASLQLTSVSQASLSSAKGTTGSASSAGGGHKVSVEQHLAVRRRTREDRLSSKDGDRSTGRITAEDAVKAGGKKADDGKSEDGRSNFESTAVNISLPDGRESASVLGTQTAPEGNARHHLLGRANLSIIVPGSEDVPDGEKKSPADGNVVTLPGLIEEVMNSKGQQISYEDVCEAILPYWPKLRKSNGERYPYSSHRQAVLESLRSRPAWAHLVDRTKGLQTYIARKRRRNESTTLSDSESDPPPDGLERQPYDGFGTTKCSKRSKLTEGEKGDGGSSSVPKCSADMSKGKRKVRRRRRLAMDDGTDGEDEPRTTTEKDPVVSKAAAAKGVSQEEEPDSISSPSSEEAVSNYSEEDEEMVVHRGMRKRRRRGDESTCSEDDMD